MTRAHWLVSGRVQGVGFRWWVRERARKLEIAGWVRNDRDGTVTIQAEGDVDALARLREMVASGPEGARVESVKDLPPGEQPGSLPAKFSIER